MDDHAGTGGRGPESFGGPQGPQRPYGPPGGPAPYPHWGPPPPRKRGFGCTGCGVAVLVCALLFSLFLNIALSVNSAAMAGDTPMLEHTYDGDPSAPDKILLLHIEGAIMKGGYLVEKDPVEEIRIRLKILESDPNIRGVIVRIESPGGGITASDDIYQMLKKVRDGGTPVYVSMGSLAASGGYYVAAAADKIVAEPTTITGSIGVLIQSYNVSELLEDWKIKDVTVASGKNKEILSMTKPVSEEHRKLIRQLVDQMYERFLDVIMEGRGDKGLTREELRKIADGRILLAADAVEHKLVDEIGYLKDTIETMKRDLNLSEARVVSYREISPLSGLFGAQSHAIQLKVDPAAVSRLLGPRALALWRP